MRKAPPASPRPANTPHASSLGLGGLDADLGRRLRLDLDRQQQSLFTERDSIYEF